MGANHSNETKTVDNWSRQHENQKNIEENMVQTLSPPSAKRSMKYQQDSSKSDNENRVQMFVVDDDDNEDDPTDKFFGKSRTSATSNASKVGKSPKTAEG